MHLYPLRTSKIFPLITPSLIYRKDSSNTIYLTFDDGPEISTTPWLLDFLKKEHIKASFFCVGKNLKSWPELAQQIVSEGHLLANHSYEHQSGWKTNDDIYVKSVIETEVEINKYTSSNKLFRPPYGRIKPSQIKKLEKMGYKIVIWSVIGGDFSKKLDTKYAIDYFSNNTKAGDIIVLHDSIMAFDNFKKILPQIIKNLKYEGYKFGILS